MTTGFCGSSPTLSLKQLSSTVAGTFEVAFFELEAIRDTAAEFEVQVGRLLEATELKAPEEGDRASYSSFFGNTGRAAAAAEDAARSLANREFQSALVTIAGALREIDECAIELSSISFLTKITQSETPAASEQVAVFVQTLDARLGELKRSSTVSSNLISAIQRQSGLARDELAAIARDFKSMMQQGESRQDRLVQLEAAHHAHIGSIKTGAGNLRAGVSQAVGGLVGCLQFPDAFAQRVDHLTAATARELEDGEARSVEIVISAQLHALSRDLGSETGKALAALQSLSDTLDADMAIGEEHGLDPSSAWIDANRRTNDAMLNAVASGRTKLGTTLGLLKDLVAQIDKAQSNLEESSRHNHELETSVHNALIVASKSANMTSPLRFLAGGVKEVVGRSSNLIARISAALARIRATSQALERTGLEKELESLAAIQENVSARSLEIAGTVEQIRAARDGLRTQSTRLTASSAAAMQAFQTAAGYAPAFSEMAGETGSATSRGEEPCPDVAWLYASYTMDVERVVHREALGLPDPEAASPDEEDEFDDFLI